MNLKLYAIFDSASGVYDGPFKARGHGEIMRMFGDICVSADHPVGKHPEHFSLYFVGEWDDTAGIPKHVDRVVLCTGEEMVSQSRQVNSGRIAEVDDLISVGGTD